MMVVPLPWDPDRYDLISEYSLFSVCWTIWDYTDFAEVRLFSFFEVTDLRTFCSVSYCIYIDSQDILDRLDEFRRVEGGRQ